MTLNGAKKATPPTHTVVMKIPAPTTPPTARSGEFDSVAEKELNRRAVAQRQQRHARDVLRELRGRRGGKGTGTWGAATKVRTPATVVPPKTGRGVGWPGRTDLEAVGNDAERRAKEALCGDAERNEEKDGPQDLSTEHGLRHPRATPTRS